MITVNCVSILTQGFVYWSDDMTSSICRADKHNGRNLQILLPNATSPGGVVIIQPVLQPNGTTSQMNSTCTVCLRLCAELCVLALTVCTEIIKYAFCYVM